MAEQSAIFFLKPEIDAQTTTDLLNYLRDCLDETCRRITEKYSVYDKLGRPRKAHIVDALTRYACPSCAVRALTQMRAKVEVDALFRENHDLAVNLLVHALRSVSEKGVIVRDEVEGEYGRLDVLVTRLSGGLLLIQSGHREVIVEIKTGMGFSLKQVLRYLLERPDAIALIWRVRKRHPLVLDGRKNRWLITLFAYAAVRQGLAVLNGEYEPCKHKQPENIPYEVDDPQEVLDSFLAGLAEGLPKVVSLILKLLNSEPLSNSERGNEA